MVQLFLFCLLTLSYLFPWFRPISALLLPYITQLEGLLFCFNFLKALAFYLFSFLRVILTGQATISELLLDRCRPSLWASQRVTWAVTSISLDTNPFFFLLRVPCYCANDLACEAFLFLSESYFLRVSGHRLIKYFPRTF